MLQNIQILVSQIIVMFLLIGVGAFCYRKKYINDDGAGQLSFILTRIVAPCVVIDSFQREFDPALGQGSYHFRSVHVHSHGTEHSRQPPRLP